MIKVSVIIPVYNVERYLRQCLDSVRSQTLKELEIICVDDGSTDSSGEILDEYAQMDERIIVIHKKNEGYGKAMNVGMAKATAPYIGFVESDDYILPEMYEKLYETASVHGTDMVKTNYYRVQTGKTEREFTEKLAPLPYNELINPEKCLDVFAENRLSAIWAALYSKNFFLENNITFHETPGASYQDTSFAFLVWYYARKVILLREAYLCYRYDSLGSSVKSSSKVFCIMAEFGRMQKALSENPKDIEIRHRLEYIKYKHYLYHYGRVADIYQYAFLLYMSNEYQKDYEEGCLNRVFWTDKDWNNMEMIRKKPERYFEQTGKGYIEKFVLANYTINKQLEKQAIQEEICRASQVVIYGTGKYGKKILNKIKEIKEPLGFAVSTINEDTPSEIDNIHVYEISELIKYKNAALIVVAVNKVAQVEVVEKLRELEFSKIYTIEIE